MSDPPSSLGGSHDSFKWSACMSLACRFSGASGASDTVTAEKYFKSRTLHNTTGVYVPEHLYLVGDLA